MWAQAIMVFKDMLRDSESLFLDTVALDYDYIPKLIPFRENEQKRIAECIKPLFNNINGRNAFIFGQPGVGKTVATKHILKELEETTDEIVPIYMNCWQTNTTYKVLVEICDNIGYKFTHNKKTEELLKIVSEKLNRKSVVFVFDEIDKAEDINFLYLLIENIYKKSVILITNFKEWLYNLDPRIKSRLTAEMIEFKPYNEKETKEILKQRMQYAFVEGAWEDEAFDKIAKKTYSLGDIRTGLYLMKESGLIAESKSSRKILINHVEEAIKKIEEFKTKDSEELENNDKEILEVIKNNSGKKIGEIYKIYLEKGGKLAYRTFQRRVSNLEKNKFITAEKIIGGAEGTTTILKYSSIKKLDEF